MKKLYLILMLILIILLSKNVIAQDESTTFTLNQKIENLEYEISIIQRDQINYRIEKDLLKESFSTNYQTII